MDSFSFDFKSTSSHPHWPFHPPSTAQPDGIALVEFMTVEAAEAFVEGTRGIQVQRGKTSNADLLTLNADRFWAPPCA